MYTIYVLYKSENLSKSGNILHATKRIEILPKNAKTPKWIIISKSKRKYKDN